VAAQYHTARFRLVPQLAKALSVPVPPLRRPGSAWTELPRPPAPDAAPAGHVRIGYARASTVRQSLDTQADSLVTARSGGRVLGTATRPDRHHASRRSSSVQAMAYTMATNRHITPKPGQGWRVWAEW
jgi:hypothetical protein